MYGELWIWSSVWLVGVEFAREWSWWDGCRVGMVDGSLG